LQCGGFEDAASKSRGYWRLSQIESEEAQLLRKKKKKKKLKK
jgi:hypothetical protein